MSADQQWDYVPPGPRYKLGSEVTVGDVIVFLGTPHRVAEIVPYRRFGACGIARAADGWGIALHPNVPMEVG